MIFLYILLGILLLLLALLLIPANLLISLRENASVVLQYAFLKFSLYPPEKKPAETKADGETKPDEKSDKPKKANVLGKLFEKETFVDGIIELCDLAKATIGDAVRLFRKVVVKKCDLRITVGDEDAAETGLKFGKVCAAVYSLRAMAEGILKFKDSSVNIKPDFENGENAVSLNLHLKLIPLTALPSLCKMGLRLIKFYRKYKKDGVSK